MNRRKFSQAVATAVACCGAVAAEASHVSYVRQGSYYVIGIKHKLKHLAHFNKPFITIPHKHTWDKLEEYGYLDPQGILWFQVPAVRNMHSVGTEYVPSGGLALRYFASYIAHCESGIVQHVLKNTVDLLQTIPLELHTTKYPLVQAHLGSQVKGVSGYISHHA